MLTIENVSLKRNDHRILDDVSLAVGPKQIVSLLGPSGCGKTTLLRVIMGLCCPDHGRVLLHDNVLTQDGVIRVQPEKRPLSFLFQDFTLLPHLTVEQNILIGIRSLPRETQRERLASLSQLLNIGPLLNEPIHRLSGGEQQRVALARTLAIEPQILLLDEPFSNLDKMTKTQLYHEVKHIIRQKGISAILATHDQEEAFFFSDQMTILRHGQLVAAGTPWQLYENPQNQWLAEFTGDSNVLTPEDLHRIFGDAFADLEPGIRLVRPESIAIAGRGDCEITTIEYYGSHTRVQCRDSGDKLLSCLSLGRTGFKKGDRVALTLNRPPVLLTS